MPEATLAPPAAPAAPAPAAPVTPATTTETPAAPDLGAPRTAPEQRPAWLPEKFKTPEDLAKAYTEAEKKIGQPPANLPPTLADLPDDADTDKILERAGLKGEDIGKQFLEHGVLTADQYKALREKAGIPKAAVDRFLKAQRAELALQERVQADITRELFQTVGGEEKWAVLRQFAQTLPKAQLESLEARIHNAEQWKGAVDELMAAHTRAVGSGGASPLLIGSGVAAPATAFASVREMHAAMAESERKHGAWNKDPVFMARYEATPQTLRRSLV